MRCVMVGLVAALLSAPGAQAGGVWGRGVEPPNWALYVGTELVAVYELDRGSLRWLSEETRKGNGGLACFGREGRYRVVCTPCHEMPQMPPLSLVPLPQ